MKLLRQYLKGIVIILAMAVFGAIFYFGGSNETSQTHKKAKLQRRERQHLGRSQGRGNADDGSPEKDRVASGTAGNASH